jgi:hypothetical protein
LKIYKVQLPLHCGGKSYELVCSNELSVKNLICSTLKRDRIPKGTVIEKVGLTKKPATRLIEKSLETKNKIKVAKVVEEVEEIVDSLRSRAKNKKSKVISSTDKDISDRLELIAIEKKQLQEKKELEESKYYNYKGIQLYKDDMITLKKDINLSNCIVFIYDNDVLEYHGIGDGAILSLKRGTNMWLYVDDSIDKSNLNRLSKHI